MKKKIKTEVKEKSTHLLEYCGLSNENMKNVSRRNTLTRIHSLRGKKIVRTIIKQAKNQKHMPIDRKENENTRTTEQKQHTSTADDESRSRD